MATATCHTEGCQNNGMPVDVGERPTSDPMTGEPLPPDFEWTIVCGPCGQPIDDVSE